MAATDLQLLTPNVLILIDSSVSGLNPAIKPPTVSFGQVKAIYTGSTRVAVNDFVLFEKDKGTYILDGTNNYVLIDEKYIPAKEFAT